MESLVVDDFKIFEVGLSSCSIYNAAIIIVLIVLVICIS